MRRVHRSLLTALVVLGLGGGSFIWVYTRDLRTRDARALEADKARRLFDFSRHDVRSGRVFARSTTIAFVRQNDRWQITAPVETPADRIAIEAALERMSKVTADPVEVPSEAAEHPLETYGLVRPTAWMEAVTSSGAVRLIVGERNVLDGRQYVTNHARARIYLADASFLWAVDRSLEAFREHRVFPIARQEVRRITSSSPAGLDFVLRRRTSDGVWFVEDRAGISRRADEGEVNSLLVALTDRLRAEHFLSEDLPKTGGDALARLGLEPFEHRFELETNDGAVLNARLGRFMETSAVENAKPVMWVEGTTTLIEVPTWAPKDLGCTSESLRNRTVSRFDRDRARRIVLEEGRKRFELERSDPEADWHVAPSKARAKTWLATAILFTTSRLKVSQVEKEEATLEDLRAMGLEPPRRRISILGENGSMLAEIRLGRRTKQGETRIADAAGRLVGTYGKGLDDLFPETEQNLIEPKP